MIIIIKEIGFLAMIKNLIFANLKFNGLKR